jgi:hypothetical protein
VLVISTAVTLAGFAALCAVRRPPPAGVRHAD